jgi:hypothetical protein
MQQSCSAYLQSLITRSSVLACNLIHLKETDHLGGRNYMLEPVLPH